MTLDAPSAEGPSRPKVTGAFLGSGVAAAGLLALAQGQLADFNLRHPVEIVLVLLLAFLGAFATAIGTARSTNAEAAEEERRLDAALAGRARQRVADRSPFDLGVRPGLRGLDPYEPRAEDETLRQALARGGPGGTDEDTAMVLLVGPPGAGKSRSAHYALFQTLPDAMLLDPVDGPAVDTLLAQRPCLGLSAQTRAILWLDSLDRYFDGLDLDSLDELLFAPQQDPSVLAHWRRATRSAGRRLGVLLQRAQRLFAGRIVNRAALAAEAVPFAVQRPVHRRVTLLATIRDDALRDALSRDDAIGLTARRLCARMQIVPLPAYDTRFTRIGTSALLHQHAATVEPHSFAQGPASHAGRGLLCLLAGVTLALVAALALIVHTEGWQVPPSFPAQVEDIENGLQACQAFRESPQKNELKEDSQWILAVSSRDCPGIDVVRYFLAEHGRLVQQFTERLATSERWSFTCLSPGSSPCLTSVPGGKPVMLGAFHSPDGRKLLPLALYRSGKVIRLYAPYLPRVSIPGKDRDSETRLMLQLQAGATYTPDPHITDGFCRSPARLCGYPAQFMAALPSSELHPALLIAGYLQHGSIFAPTQVALRAYGLHYVQQRIRLGPHSCLFYQAGEQVAKSEISLEIGENVVDRMRQSWTPKRDLRESVIC